MAARQVSERRMRAAMAFTAAVHLFLAAMTVVAGWWAATRALEDDQGGAAAWYGLLAVAAVVPIAAVAFALLQLRRSTGSQARRLTRVVWLSYGVIAVLVLVAVVTVVMTDVGPMETLIVMIAPVNVGFVFPPVTLSYFKHRSANPAPEDVAASS